MKKFFKKICSVENLSISFLVVLVVSIGYLAFFQDDLKTDTSLKSNSNSKVLSGYNNYNNYSNQSYNTNQSQTTQSNYQNLNYTNNNNYNYTDTTAPAIEWNPTIYITQYDNFDPMSGVRASHLKFGDVTHLIEVTYNDVNTSIPGKYSVVYKACNYPGSNYCRTVSSMVVVNQKTYGNQKQENTKTPLWSSYSKVSCAYGSASCSTERISKPTAKDPVTNRALDVYLVSGSVNIYEPGTYTLIYGATTSNGISGTVAKLVTIKQPATSNSTTNYPQSKYIENHSSQYYDDGMYRGTLNKKESSQYINEYKWTNVVTSVYRCVNYGQYGTNGWEFVKNTKSNGQYTDQADNHPTYYYSSNGYSGYLNKTNFYFADPQYKLNSDLGYCNNVGQTKEVNKTWVGIYSGYVYSNNNSYSGYVYLYK